MGDAWRVTATFDNPAPAKRSVRELAGHEVQAQVRQRLDGRVAVAVTDLHLCLCAGTREGAVAAEAVIRAVLAAHRLRARVATHFWDPSIDRWVNTADSVPDDTGLALVPPRHRRGSTLEVAVDTRIADATGSATWAIRIKLASHHDAVSFARRLKAQGHPPVRRWKRLLVGSRNQDEAQALAASICAQAPPWAVISVFRTPYTAPDVAHTTQMNPPPMPTL